MRISITVFVFCALWIVEGVAIDCHAQSVVGGSGDPPAAVREESSKFTFILFWKEDNAVTREFMSALKPAMGKRSNQAAWSAINVTDPANRATVEKYKVSRAPMPMVMCIAPTGAITGAITDRVTDEAIEQALVTPAMCLCMRSLQDGKLVLVHVKKDVAAPWPTGAYDFAADPEFQARTARVSFCLADPAEARFLKDMQLNPAEVTGSVVSLLAPPGVLVGKFAGSATKEQIAAQLHASGQCCDDPNCKHNQGVK